MSEPTILIVDDEKPIRDMVRMGLEMSGFHCLEAADSGEAYQVIIDKTPDLVLLDWMMPGGSGVELLRKLKKDDRTNEIPVIMVTAKTDEDNRIQGLETGADDYVSKPFSPRELIARIRAVLRRSGFISEDEVIEVEGLKLDNAGHRVYIDDQSIFMGPTEYRLLTFFMTHPDRVYSRSQLLDQVWGNNVYVEERTVDVHIRRLRKALQSVPSEKDYGKLVQTVRGAGYRFSANL